MSTAVADLLGGLVAYLLENNAVAAECDVRVFGLELPAEEAQSMPRKCVVLTVGSGSTPAFAETLQLDALTINAYCYGVTPFEAMQVRRAVRAAMKDLSRVVQDGVLLHWAKPAGGFAEERDPQTNWPRVFESFSVLAAEIAVA